MNKTDYQIKVDKKSVRLSDLRMCLDFLRMVNETPFNEIRWTDGSGNEVIPTDSKRLRLMSDWEHIGLSNVDYGKILLDELEEKMAALNRGENGQERHEKVAESDEDFRASCRIIGESQAAASTMFLG